MTSSNCPSRTLQVVPTGLDVAASLSNGASGGAAAARRRGQVQLLFPIEVQVRRRRAAAAWPPRLGWQVKAGALPGAAAVPPSTARPPGTRRRSLLARPDPTQTRTDEMGRPAPLSSNHNRSALH